MFVTRTSPISGKTNTMYLDITDKEADSYVNGSLVQNAFPRLTASEREFILTGITPAEWDQMFGIEDAHD